MQRSVLWTCWFNAWLGGLVPIDECRDRVLRDDAAHDVLGLDPAGPVPLLQAWGMLVRRGAQTAQVALPAPGDLHGLAGPPAFNEAVLDAEEAVVLAGASIGLVPQVVGRGVFWRVEPAVALRAPLTLREAEHRLREQLVGSARELTDLDAARWLPEMREALSQVRTPTGPVLAPGYEPRSEQLAALAQRCRSICSLADAAPDGTLSAAEWTIRHRSLADLDRAARHALVAACNDRAAVQPIASRR